MLFLIRIMCVCVEGQKGSTAQAEVSTLKATALILISDSSHRNLSFGWTDLSIFFQVPSYAISLVAQTVKNPTPMQEIQVWSLGWEHPLEKAMATHSSILAWRIPWTVEPGRIESMGLQNNNKPWVSSVQYFSCVRLFATPWTAARQASLSTTNSQSLLKLMSI